MPAQASKTNAQKCSCASDAPAPLSLMPLSRSLACSLRFALPLPTSTPIQTVNQRPSSAAPLSLSRSLSPSASIKSCLCTLINIFILMIFIIAHIRYFLCGREDQSWPQVLYTSASTCCASSFSLSLSLSRVLIRGSQCQAGLSTAAFHSVVYLYVLLPSVNSEGT